MNGYTKVDNWLFDTVMPSVKPNTFKVVAAIVRKTAGWNKPTDVISLSEFHKITGISSRRTLCDAIDDAISEGFIKRAERGGSFEYCTIGSTETVPDQYRNGTGSGTETVPIGSTETVHTKEKEKDTIKALAQSFTEATGLFPNPGSYDRLWEPVLEHWLTTYGGGAADLITEAVTFARSKNFTIKSPASIDTIIANLKQPGRVNGILEVPYR